MKEKYEIQKNENLQSIILIKYGNFYATINDDSFIMKKLFNYQIIKGKVGFPLNAIDKVKSKLNDLRVNYLIYNSEDDIDKQVFDDNTYNAILNECKKQEYKDNMKKLLFDRIEYLINDNSDNYDKIRKFVDEL